MACIASSAASGKMYPVRRTSAATGKEQPLKGEIRGQAFVQAINSPMTAACTGKGRQKAASEPRKKRLSGQAVKLSLKRIRPS